jgi:hypothetical protein
MLKLPLTDDPATQVVEVAGYLHGQLEELGLSC